MLLYCLLDNRDLQGCWCWSCGVVACKDNGKVGGCSDGCIVGGNSCKVVVVVWGLGWVRG